MRTPKDATPTTAGELRERINPPSSHRRSSTMRRPVWPYGALAATLTFALGAGLLWYYGHIDSDQKLLMLTVKHRRDIEQIQDKHTVLLRAALEKAAGCVTVAVAAPSTTPAFAVHKLQKNEALLSLGHRYCGLTSAAEPAFLKTMLALNKDGDARRPHPPRTIADLNTVNPNEEWRFPAACHFPPSTPSP